MTISSRRFVSFVGVALLAVSMIAGASAVQAAAQVTESFERPKMKKGWWSIKGHEGTITQEVGGREGANSYRIAVGQMHGKNIDEQGRSELFPGQKMARIGYGLPYRKGQWFGFSLYVPKDHKPIPVANSVDTLFQLFESQDRSQNHPILTVKIQNEELVGTYTSTRKMTADKYVRQKTYPMLNRFSVGKMVPGEWHDIVIYVKPSPYSDGEMKIFLNGREQVKRKGSVGLLSGDSFYFRIGVTNPSLPYHDGGYERVYYYDSIRVAQGNASGYRNVAPRGKRVAASRASRAAEVVSYETNHKWVPCPKKGVGKLLCLRANVR